MAASVAPPMAMKRAQQDRHAVPQRDVMAMHQVKPGGSVASFVFSREHDGGAGAQQAEQIVDR
ncbi:hypothetical protein W822_22610 [Advenella kashmirensis W13003]|uniref:Uncharacterized protein n=1 Tax=Advenella kashmirensis W13003 TaxID=1424334 RepID=V8QKY8_9BURK|nr:hypothetical protein W822_22610 [Advenella kashmirensis W13003]